VVAATAGKRTRVQRRLRIPRGPPCTSLRQRLPVVNLGEDDIVRDDDVYGRVRSATP